MRGAVRPEAMPIITACWVSEETCPRALFVAVIVALRFVMQDYAVAVRVCYAVHVNVSEQTSPDVSEQSLSARHSR